MSTLLEKGMALLNQFKTKNAVVFWNGKKMPEFSCLLQEDKTFNSDLQNENEYAFLLPQKRILEEPIYILYITDTPSQETHQRTLVIEEDCDVSLVEIYLSNNEVQLQDSISKITASTILKIGANTKLNHVMLHQGYHKTLHINNTLVEQANNSEYCATTLLLGGHFTLSFDLKLKGRGAKAQFNTLEFPKRGQTQEIVLTVVHQAPQCESHTIARCVVAEKAKSTFKGKIIVEATAHDTNAFLENKNLLLSPSAEANTSPELEIYNKEVRCSHGATVGYLDSEALFYLRSRGIAEEEAKSMLIKSFIQPSLSNIKTTALLAYIEQVINEN
jgi:Fe-S cluster assembly protein SufD